MSHGNLDSFSYVQTGHVFTKDELISAYLNEMEGFSSGIRSGYLAEFLRVFDGGHYGEVLPKGGQLKRIIKKSQETNDAIRVENPSLELRKCFYLAHMAMCCMLFRGWHLPAESISTDGTALYVRTMVEKLLQNGHGSIEGLKNILHRADTVRVTCLLRCLGLLKHEAKRQIQLAIGAGTGERDIEALHFHSSLEYMQEHEASPLLRAGKTMLLGGVVNYPSEVALVDADNAFSEHYRHLNERRDLPYKVLALNSLVSDALPEVTERQARGEIRPITLISGFRVDQIMFPNVAGFFSGLAPTLADISELVMTIGAGHSLEQYEGREQLMAEMSGHLSRRGMSPVRLRLAFGETAKDRRDNIAFGIGPISSYEILYCKLKKKRLMR